MVRKGFLEGTQTKGGFVPEQHTDLYYSRRRMGFCWFLSCNGAICRIVAQNNLLSRTTKKQTVGFMVTVLQEFYLHFFVNIAMVSGIYYWSSTSVFFYGGSGLWGFTLLFYQNGCK
jgi:rod shape determining protein RodA